MQCKQHLSLLCKETHVTHALTNKERNSIQAAIFQKHIQATHPNVTCDEMPPEHTLIIEGNITSSISNTTWQRIDRHLRHRIITSCGDANVMMGSKHIDHLI